MCTNFKISANLLFLHFSCQAKVTSRIPQVMCYDGVNLLQYVCTMKVTSKKKFQSKIKLLKKKKKCEMCSKSFEAIAA